MYYNCRQNTYYFKPDLVQAGNWIENKHYIPDNLYVRLANPPVQQTETNDSRLTVEAETTGPPADREDQQAATTAVGVSDPVEIPEHVTVNQSEPRAQTAVNVSDHREDQQAATTAVGVSDPVETDPLSDMIVEIPEHVTVNQSEPRDQTAVNVSDPVGPDLPTDMTPGVMLPVRMSENSPGETLDYMAETHMETELVAEGTPPGIATMEDTAAGRMDTGENAACFEIADDIVQYDITDLVEGDIVSLPDAFIHEDAEQIDISNVDFDTAPLVTDTDDNSVATLIITCLDDF